MRYVHFGLYLIAFIALLIAVIIRSEQYAAMILLAVVTITSNSNYNKEIN